jgi:hypothetical protein
VPVFASIAKTFRMPVVTYMTPSITTGVPSSWPPRRPSSRRMNQAPPSWVTVDVLIWSSAEYRQLA